MLSVSKLSKSFRGRVAVDAISFEILSGETVGFLGPNGAGKTTTLAMIGGLVAADAGVVLLDGEPVSQGADAPKRRIGLVPQDVALYEELSARANLELFGGLYGVPGPLLAQRATEALELVGLSDQIHDRVSGFSGGMKRRLNIAGALLHDPALILLDEPTVGVDPQSRNAIFENIEELKRRGKTLLYTTHYMEEAERLCDRILIIDHGRIVADDTPHGLYARLPASREAFVDLDRPEIGAALLDRLATVPGVIAARQAPRGVRVEVSDFGAVLARCLEIIVSDGRSVQSVQAGRVSLERVFMTLTGRALRDDSSDRSEA